MIRTRARTACATVLLAGMGVVLAGCGDPKDASLCTAYAEFLDSRATVQAIDPDNLNAKHAKDLAQSYLDSVQRLKQAADNRYGQEIYALELAVNDLLLTLAPIPDDADFATWGPLVQDDLESAADAATVVESAVEPSCTPDTSGD